MKKKITYTDEPLGNIQVVEDFLSPPEQLVFKEERIKVTDCKHAERRQSVNYNSGPFRNVYHTPLGRKLWKFLNRASTIRQMQNASDGGRPAVEPLGAPLLAQFGSQAGEDRIKQMIGHMVKQVLERNGYEWVRYGGSVRPSGRPFTSGSLYKRR